MTIMIISNAKGIQNNKYNKLGNNQWGNAPPVLLDRNCMYAYTVIASYCKYSHTLDYFYDLFKLK